MAKYKIHPIVVGSKVIDKGIMTYQYNYGTEFHIPVYVWYLEGGDKKILVDTALMGILPSKEREERIGGKIYTFEEGLAKWGLKPEDIDIVIHTHLHNDHCENDIKCTNAKFYIHKLEMEQIHDPKPLDFRYELDFIEAIENAGKIVVVEGDEMEIVDGVRVLHTPSHTPGSLTVLVDTKEGLAAITGFCVINENFDPPPAVKAMEMEVLAPGVHVNVYEAYNQVIRVRDLADIILPLHEPSFSSVDTIG
ncbi:MAG: MBL fold metallo-hydrolase [Candidatus Aquicultor primus]|uniref:MBL fold metallo-hydrolase n=1 Tax=Candidatus Aquicultor primus TaxID=1797195 RepID=A0A1F2UT41_9ACTN|nr:MAG: MBL fold metallo-hydrolase [Candidatus Aquicultor primus]HCG99254.1 MBL fold metallo-hydrolase [Actinomycetota bacterium]